MSCRDKTLHAQDECECCFTPDRFLELLEYERQWFDLLDALRRQRGQRAWSRESPEGHAVIIMLRNHAHWLRN
jgi:hypothetical protein